MRGEFITTVLANPTLNASFLADGLEMPGTGFQVRADTVIRPPTIRTLSLVETHPNTTVATLTQTHIDNFFEFFREKGYTHTTYRMVKTLRAWREAYGVAPRFFERNSALHGLMNVSEDATYCRACRILLPLRVLSIDHQKAQAGGGTAAILRVFRGLGLTRAAPRGAKNRAAVAGAAASVGGNPDPPLGPRPHRYTLNEAGAIYYTVFKAARILDRLEYACLHHYLNLRPVCGPCNSALRNSNVF